MTSAASLLSNTQPPQDAYERGKTPDRVGTLSMAAQGASMIAVDRVVELNIDGADKLASSSDGSLTIDHDPSRSGASVDGSTPESQLDDRDELRRRMSIAARAAVEAARNGAPENTQIPS